MSRILIGLRNRVYADYIGYCLKMQGQEVEVVDDGIDIVNLLFSKDWNIAVIGIHLSYYNGLEILERYNKYFHEMTMKALDDPPARLRIFIASSVYDRMSILQAKKLGAENYFVMPQDTDVFLNDILKKDSL